jgi:hypothetical protein
MPPQSITNRLPFALSLSKGTEADKLGPNGVVDFGKTQTACRSPWACRRAQRLRQAQPERGCGFRQNTKRLPFALSLSKGTEAGKLGTNGAVDFGILNKP